MAEPKDERAPTFFELLFVFVAALMTNPIAWIVLLVFILVGLPALVITCGAFIDGIFGTEVVEHLRQAWARSK